VIGGVPSYLEKITPALNAEENIRQLCFISNGILVHEFKQIFTDIFGKRSEKYKKILYTLIEKPHSTLSDIYDTLSSGKQGIVSDYLADLEEAGFVKRDHAFQFNTQKTSKHSTFRICDNFIRFYLKFIEPNLTLIEQDRFENTSLSTLKNWETIAGLQFENLVLNNKSTILDALMIRSSDVIFDNPYVQMGNTKKPGVQVDYLIVDKFNTIWLCEIKFSKHQIGSFVIQEIQKKIAHLNTTKAYSIRPVLIHVNGVTDELIAEGFFAHIIDFANLLSSEN